MDTTRYTHNIVRDGKMVTVHINYTIHVYEYCVSCYKISEPTYISICKECKEKNIIIKYIKNI